MHLSVLYNTSSEEINYINEQRPTLMSYSFIMYCASYFYTILYRYLVEFSGQCSKKPKCLANEKKIGISVYLLVTGVVAAMAYLWCSATVGPV